jgi:4-aminobutyrate aminotransferase-like enzyme
MIHHRASLLTVFQPGIVERAWGESGLVVLTRGTYDNVLRFLPPLVIAEPDLSRGLPCGG